MKLTRSVPFAALAILLATGCDKSAAAPPHPKLPNWNARPTRPSAPTGTRTTTRRPENRRRTRRHRARAHADRGSPRGPRAQQNEAAAAEAEKLRQREEALANREGKLEQLETTLEEKDDQLQQRGQQLNERERELAGREALALAEPNGDDDPTPVGDYGMFHDSLSPYGSWFETPDYGYVWQPVIVRDSSWRPYTRGRWVCSDHGWTWVSDEPFGWATYHYGAGPCCAATAGSGCPAANGLPPGSHGAPAAAISAGHRCHRKPSPIAITTGTHGGCDLRHRRLMVQFRGNPPFRRPIHRHCLPYHQNNAFYPKHRQYHQHPCA